MTNTIETTRYTMFRVLESLSVTMSKDETRFHLNGVCFRPDGEVTSTDGHRATRMRCDGGVLGWNSDLEKEYILAGSDIPRIIKSLKCKPKDDYPLIVTFTDEKIDFGDYGRAGVIEAQFPPIDKVDGRWENSRDISTESVGLNAKYMADVYKATKNISNEHKGTEVFLSGELDPVYTVTCCDIVNVPWTHKCTIMPMRVN